MERLDESFVFASIRPREPDSHKGSYGHVLLAAGSRRCAPARGSSPWPPSSL